MARFYDILKIYSDDTKTTLLGTYEVKETDISITSISSDAGISIPQNANGFYYEGTIYGLNDFLTFDGMGDDYDGYFTYSAPSAEKITGFFLDGQEYKIGGDEAAWGNISGTLSDQTDLNTALTAKANASDVLTKTNTTSFIPTADYHPATKKYVDDNAGTEYNAGPGIEIGTYNDYLAMRGPAPDGFHVPLTTEWQGLKTIMDGLSLTLGNNWRTNLHMPFAGFRYQSNAELNSQDSMGSYWSSSPYGSAYPTRACYLYLNDSYRFSVNAHSYDNRTNGRSVRCFKNSFTVPTSSWTVINGTLGGAGIFRNQTEGIISITSDGITGYTIQDKNLGATTVYNNGDALTQANMGNMYQWGNNYGFPSTGSVTTSSTQVDASNYGPGNYYSSSTFIIGSNDWSSVLNDDLWGGVTGVVINAITNTGVLSVNGETGNVTVSSGAEIVYATQAEYDTLPSSKLTDGKHYFIYE